MDFSGVSISLKGGVMDELYKEWSGISYLDNAGNAVHDSVECTDFAEYCIREAVSDLEELRKKYAETVEQPGNDSLCSGLNNAAIRIHKDSKVCQMPDVSFIGDFKVCVKDTFEDEIVDAIRRLLDIAGNRGIDVEKHLDLKPRYNSTRPDMHGKSC